MTTLVMIACAFYVLKRYIHYRDERVARREWAAYNRFVKRGGRD